jgi:hypothetical protein
MKANFQNVTYFVTLACYNYAINSGEEDERLDSEQNQGQ